MTARLHAWLRQAHSDLAMAAYASDGGFHAQACYHCSQAVEKALKAVLLAMDQEPPRTHSIERLLCALELMGIETAPLRQLPLKPLQRMTTASRYPVGDEAPVDLFDEKDGALALEVARAVVGFADQQLGDLDQSESS
ncbi:MAG: HEPN domain-containing protein [Cyanobacteriota bacterium]